MKSTHAPKVTPKDEARLWSHTDRTGECWVWTAGRNKDGYGMINVDRRALGAHRVAYLVEHGFWSSNDVHIDHLCRNTACIRPAHLEAVPRRVNVARGLKGHITHCPHGHEYTPANTDWVPRPSGMVKVCRTCEAAYRHGQNLRRRADRRLKKGLDPYAGESNYRPTIRQWARSKGYQIGTRGRIADDIIAAYYAAYPKGTLA